MASLDALRQEFDDLVSTYTAEIARTSSEQELRKVFANFGGTQGQVRNLQKQAIKAAAAIDKRAVGQLGNAAMETVERQFASRLEEFAQAARKRDLERTIDLTLPGIRRPIGHLHPITLIRRELVSIFAELGFVVADGPHVETDFNNFEALAMPKDHPARDMQDTFYVDGAPDLVLRTHTSPVQIREMLSHPPPVRIIAPGTCYRKDEDPTHSPMFHQIEGLCVDRDITFADLKGVLLHFVKRLFSASRIRLRPSFFPFTEPSAEVDMGCVFCDGKGCRTCKQSGFIELGGAGMVDPDVFAKVGYDPTVYSGFAFGFGLERMAMLRYGIDHIQHFFDGDVRFAAQFRS